MNDAEPDAVQRRCLVVTPAADLGRLILSLPTLEALAASGRRLVVLTEGTSVPLLRLAPAAPEALVPSSSGAETRSAVGAARCGEAVVLCRTLEAAWFVRATGIPLRWGYGGGLRRLLLNRPVRRPAIGLRHACDDFRELLEAMDAALSHSAAQGIAPDPRLVLSEPWHERARERLERAHVRPDGSPLVGIYAGVRGGGSGRPWPRRSFEELLRRLRRRRPEIRWIILATTEDLWTAVRLFEETAKIHPVIGPDLRLDGLAAVLAQLDLFLGADSWMLQLAAAAGTRSLGLFAREPRRWAPRGQGHRVVAKASLGLIAVDEVMEVFEQVWTTMPMGR